MPLLAPIADYESLAYTSCLWSPIELLASEQNYITQNNLRHELACTYLPRFANILSICALQPEDTLMMGLGEVTNLKIYGREEVE